MGTGDPVFSRSGVTAEAGKCTARIDVPCPPELVDALVALSYLHDKPKAEFARMLLTKAIHGELAYMRSIGLLPPNSDGTNKG